MKVLSDMQGKRILVNPIDDYCNYKGDFIMAIVHMMGDLHEKSGKIEYKMPEAMAKAYLKARGSEDMKMHPNAYLWLYSFYIFVSLCRLLLYIMVENRLSFVSLAQKHAYRFSCHLYDFMN